MNGLERLQKWSRKYYSFEIVSGRSIQPGDGVSVKLQGGGRTVQVYDDDFRITWGDDGEDRECTIDELIGHALDRWEQDDSPKHFEVLCHSRVAPIGGKVKFWTGETYMAYVEGKNEEEAKAKAMACFSGWGSPRVIAIWEKETG